MPYKKAALRHMEPHKHKGQAEQGRSGVPAGQHVQVFSIKIYLLFAELAKATLTLKLVRNIIRDVCISLIELKSHSNHFLICCSGLLIMNMSFLARIKTCDVF